MSGSNQMDERMTTRDCSTKPGVLHGIIAARVPGRVLALFLPALVIPVLFLFGCATGPQTQVVVKDSFAIEAVQGTSKQTLGGITVEDLGEQSHVVTPVRVQACKGSSLLFREVKQRDEKGKTHTKRHPVFVEVDPFRNLYVRRLKIRNDTEHVLFLDRIDAVFVDAAGNDNEHMDMSTLRQYLHSVRPCRSTRAVIATLRSLKFLGSGIRLRPGRVTQVLAVFSGIDRRILGDWMLELHGVPVETDPAGRVSRVATFSFPFRTRGYRTTVVRHKETTFGPWQELSRKVEEIDPGS